jgi:hypothetical protein
VYTQLCHHCSELLEDVVVRLRLVRQSTFAEAHDTALKQRLNNL